MHYHYEKKNLRVWFKHFHVEFAFFNNSCGVGIELNNDCESTIKLLFQIPLILSFYFLIDSVKLAKSKWWEKFLNCGYEGRRVSVNIHHFGLWIDIWAKTMSWNSKDPWWQNIHIDFLDLLFGKAKYSKTILETGTTNIVMPEKTYKANVKIFNSHWTRPRWLKKTIRRAEVEVKEGIPHPGKGTCSYNCGDDATFSTTQPYKGTIEKAGDLLKESVMYCRNNYPL